MAQALTELLEDDNRSADGTVVKPIDPDKHMETIRADHAAVMARARAESGLRYERQRSRGRLTTRERITTLTDPGTFRELDTLRTATGTDASPSGDGVVTGTARIHDRTVFLYAQDFTVNGGSLGQVHADKIVRLLTLAEKARCPVVGLFDGGGARIQEGALALDGCGAMFEQIVRLSGVVPQISVVLGPCAGAAAYAPALTDVVFMVRGSGLMCLTGPDVVEKVTGQRVAPQVLGGADVHGRHSGVATFVHDDELTCFEDVRYLISMLPSHNGELPPRLVTDDPVDRSIARLVRVVPADPALPYDMHDVIDLVLDQDTFMEFHEGWAPNIVCGLGRLDGRIIGVVANQPAVMAGVIDIPAAEKAARFVAWCDAFSIPLVTLVDVPGFMPGTDQEHAGIIRHGAKLLHAYSRATVPRIQLILRKAYGGAYIVMDSPSIGNDLSFAWPVNEVAVMGPEAAVEIIHKRELAASTDEGAERHRLHARYRAEQLNPYSPARNGLTSEVIDPVDTRVVLAHALTLLAHKATAGPDRKHSNSPL